MSEREEIITPKEQGRESYDTLGASTLYSWQNNTDDYKLIAEALQIWFPTHTTIKILSQVNKYVHSDKYIFDGTINNLKFLVENNLLNIEDITDDAVYGKELKRLLRKYLKPNIDDIFKGLPQEEMMKELFINHTKFFLEYLSLYPHSRDIYERLPKNDEEMRELFGLDENLNEDVVMEEDRWSPQAIRCKMVLLCLYADAGKLTTYKGSKTADILSSLTEEDIDNRNESKTVVVNALWVGLSHQPWNEKKSFTFQDLIMTDGISINLKGTDLYIIYNKILYPLVKKVAENYFTNFDNSHPMTFPIRYAVIVILYRAIDETSGKERHASLRFDGMFNKFWEYVFDDKGQLKQWFVDYFEKELELRIKFIDYCQKLDIFRLPWNKQKILYFPAFESFRFITKQNLDFIYQLKKFFESKEVDDSFKNIVLKPIVFNIQKTFLLGKRNDWEERVKDTMLLFLMLIFKPLKKHTIDNIIAYRNLQKNKSQIDELKQIADIELMNTILKYDASINPNFLGYIKKMLPLNIISASRQGKIVRESVRLDEVNNNYQESSYSDKEFIEKINSKTEFEKVRKALASIPPKQRAAIEKAAEGNEKLNESERRNKNRGIEKLRKQLTAE